MQVYSMKALKIIMMIMNRGVDIVILMEHVMILMMIMMSMKLYNKICE